MTSFKKVGANLLALLSMFPQLSIVGIFTGSALMTQAVLLGIAPKPLQQDVFAAYAKFIGLPLLHPTVSALGWSARNVMLALSVTHLVAVALLLLPSGTRPAKLAGIWVMIAMVGAEYVTRAADVAPPMTPEEFKWHGQVLGSICHVFLFLCGAYCAARTSSLGLASAVLGCKQKAVDGCQDSKGSIPKDPKASAKKQDTANSGTYKVDAKDPKDASRKRTSTPPPKAKKTK